MRIHAHARMHGTQKWHSGRLLHILCELTYSGNEVQGARAKMATMVELDTGKDFRGCSHDYSSIGTNRK